MNPNSNRSMLLAVVGGYLIYLAYDMIKSMIDEIPTTMPRWLLIFFSALFVVLGVILLIFAWRSWKKGREGKEEDRVEIPEEEDETKDEEKENKK